MLGAPELILILLIVVMLFGAKRIPEIMSGLGKGIKTFKKAMEGEDDPQTLHPPAAEPPPAPTPSQQRSESPDPSKEKTEQK